jgi:hypothetical protein
MNWRPFDRETAPKDRPIAILVKTDYPNWVTTIEVCEWKLYGDGFDGFFIVGGLVGRQHRGGTHWCEVEELELPSTP